MKIQLEHKGGTAEVTVHLTLKIDATGPVGDGSQILCLGAHLEGGARELAYLKTQFETDDLWVTQREEDGTWRVYTTRFNGRTDWPAVHADFQELVAVLSALLSLLRFSNKRLTCKNLNWFGPDQTYGFIGELPADIHITASTDNHVTLPDLKP